MKFETVIQAKVFFVLFVIILVSVYSAQIEEIPVRFGSLEGLLPLDGLETEIDRDSSMWRNHEFDTGIGNREEISIENIEIWENLKLKENITNWQVLEFNGKIYLAGFEKYTFFMYHFDMRNHTTSSRAIVPIVGTILSAKLISLPQNASNPWSDSSIQLAMVVQTNKEKFYLKWFDLQDETFVEAWIMSLTSRVKNLEYFGSYDKHKLLLAYEGELYYNQTLSVVEIYDINTDRHLPKLQLCHKFSAPEIFDVKICQFEGTRLIISLVNVDSILLYEYRDEDAAKCNFKQVRIIKATSLTGVICFESGYMHYLAILNSSLNIFNIDHDEHLHPVRLDESISGEEEIKSVQSIPVTTYRDESLLLVQLKNSSVSILSWHGLEFRKIPLPSKVLDGFELAKATMLSYYGFLVGKTLAKLDVKLYPLSKPYASKLEEIMSRKSKIEEILEMQESMIRNANSITERNVLDNPRIEPDHSMQDELEDETNSNQVDSYSIPSKIEDSSSAKFMREYKKIDGLMFRLESKLYDAEEILYKKLEESIPNRFTPNIEIEGSLEIIGTLSVANLTIDTLNGVEMDILTSQCAEKSGKIGGIKHFPTIEFTDDNLKIRNLNDLPLNNYEFHENLENNSYVDLSNIRKIDVKRHLNFTNVFGQDWHQMIKNIVLKNENKIIPGVTTVTGVTSARLIFMDHLNGIQYPSDYIVKSGPLEAVMTGKKFFKTLRVSDLQGVETINGIDADDFITTNANQDLEHQITFKDLVIDETFQIDGRIVGLPNQDIDPDLTLLNSNLVQSNVELTTLHVTGKVYIQNSIAGVKWSELDDLVMKDEEIVQIAGVKTFLNHVHVAHKLDIDTRRINGHLRDNFVTLDTAQIFSNLSRMSGNVNFMEVTYDEIENLENAINSELSDDGTPLCLDKSIIFTQAPVLDEFSTSYINGNITGLEFADKLFSMMKFVKFENLRTQNLIVNELISTKINNVSTDDLKNHRITKRGYQNISGNVTIQLLEVDRLYSDYVNGIPSSDLEILIDKINDLYDGLISGNQYLRSMKVEGNVITPSINDIDLREILNFKTITGLILPDKVSIESVTVDGFVNGLNFTSQVHDTVFKTDEFVTLSGQKRVQKLKSQNLHVDFVNGRPSKDLIDTDENQIIKGAVRVKGALSVQNSFNLTGKMNDIPFQKFSQNIFASGDGVYQMTGNFIAKSQVSIEHLDVFGRVQSREIPAFIDDLITMSQKDVTISGTKTFLKSINFAGDIFLTKNLNQIDLDKFYKGATLIDSPIFFNSKIVFENDILIEDSLNVSTMEVGSIKGLDIADLMENAVYLERPTFLSEAVTLSDVVFESDVKIKSWNNVDMESLFTLNTDQYVKDVLVCIDASVENFEVKGLINGENLDKIYETTFTLSTDQNITGQMSFLNEVHMKFNFDSKYINGVDIFKTISLDQPGSITGNFVFHSPLVFESHLKVFGKLSDIDISEWNSTAIMTNSKSEQRIKADFVVHGNVGIARDITGLGLINGFDVMKLSDHVSKKEEHEKTFISREMNSLKSMCTDLRYLKDEVKNMPYLFKSFENFASIFFDERVVSFHHFTYKKFDYIMTNLESCRLDVFAMVAGSFDPIANMSNFGYVKEYVTLNYQEHLYIATMGKSDCGMSPGNLWKFQNNQFRHVLDLGNVTDMKQLGDDGFVVIADHQVKEWLIKDVLDNHFKPVNVIPMKDRRAKFFMNENETLLASPDTIYDLRTDVSGFDEFENPFKSNNIITFQAGVGRKEFIILYEEQTSKDHFSICSNDLSRRKVQQVIQAHRPSSFLIVNFDQFQQNLLIFIENRRIIQIYEYHGIEGFKHHSSIRMKVDRIFIFKMRTMKFSVETFFLAAIQEDKLSILEAKMHGSRLDIESDIECPAQE
ncbi:hypothetical protein QAD02_010319 [Eretmocerus hayati]|uniref:Uncharacterized protein n=1 Tax=Eretmocerus hayati TaxID=131215 RepID=A0ACC2NCK8_9HYME|nr:hypothetical protein QAD02_010319 [Eretmocerus hayati]